MPAEGETGCRGQTLPSCLGTHRVVIRCSGAPIGLSECVAMSAIVAL